MTAKIAALLLAGIFAAAGEPDLSGSWVGPAGKIILTEKDGNLRVQEFDGGKQLADYTCALDGRECAVKESGHSEKVMLYFNGPKLVEIKERGNNDTVKRRFTLNPDGKTLEVEMIPLSDEQKPETLTFQREAPANVKSSS